MDSRKLVFIALALSAAAGAHAQTAGVVTLRANQTSATGSLTPVLTWSTNPVATSCTASGGWSGSRNPSGSQTQATIRANTNYTLTCRWGAAGSAIVRWTAPTQNTNNSTLTNLAGFRVAYGTSATNLSQVQSVTDMTARQATVQSLAAGTWYFAVRAFTTSGAESGNSGVVTKTVTGASASATVAITVNPTSPPPPPPTTPPPTKPPPQDPGLINPTPPVQNDGRRLTVKITEATEIVRSGTWYRLGRVVGTIPRGTPCDKSFRAGGRYRIPRNLATLTLTPVSQDLVAECEWSGP